MQGLSKVSLLTNEMPPHGNRLSQSTLADVVYEVPCLLEFLDPKSRASLSGCSKYLQRLVHSVTTTVTIDDISDVESLVKADWPCLALVIVAGYAWLSEPPWPKHSSLQLLTALNLCHHHHHHHSAAAFVVAAKPKQYKQKLSATLSRMRVSEIRQLIGELVTKLQHSTGSRHTTSQSQLHRQHLATAIAYLASSRRQQPHQLQMQYNGCGAETITQLSTANWASVECLDLSTSPLDAAGIAALVKGSWASLGCLHLTGKRLDSAAVTQLIRDGPWSHLVSLHLQSCSLGADSIAVMSTAVMPKLERLWLNKNKLDAAAATLLANADWPRLWTLCLSDNHLNNTAMACLAQKQWPKLRMLCIDDNDVDVIGIEHLRQQSWPALRELNIGKNTHCAATWQALGLQQSDMSKVELGKARRIIQIKREVLHHDPVWPNLCWVNFCPPRPTSPDHLSVHEDGYMLATSLLVQVVLLMDQSLGRQQAWDAAFTASGTAFYSAASRGVCTYLFANLHQHTFTPLEKANVDPGESATLEQQVNQYPSLKEALQLDWSALHPCRTHKLICILAACARFEQMHNRPAVAADLTVVEQIIDKHIAAAEGCKIQVPDASIAEFLCAEPLPAVNAICGGVLANELLKAVSHNDGSQLADRQATARAGCSILDIRPKVNL